MFGHIAFNRGPFNRQENNGSSWSGSAQAVSAAEAILRITKYMGGNANAVSSGLAYAGIIHYMVGLGEAIATGVAVPIRKRYFSGHADAVAAGKAVGLYQIGTDFIALDINLREGDDLIIDTERMTLIINNENAIYTLSDDSTFFNLAKGDFVTVSGNGTATITLLWKDRWL